MAPVVSVASSTTKVVLKELDVDTWRRYVPALVTVFHVNVGSRFTEAAPLDGDKSVGAAGAPMTVRVKAQDVMPAPLPAVTV